MIKQPFLSFSLVLLVVGTAKLYPQCIPDANCRDTLLPGEVCPTILPDAYLGATYSQTVTILPPPTAVIADVGISIYKINIDTITNLPPGISYEASATDMVPGTAYCVLISGIPAETGEYVLTVSVTPFILLMDSVVQVPVVVNDSSVKMTVREPAGLASPDSDGSFSLISGPNPFPEITVLGFLLDEYQPVQLHVYDGLGSLIYRETTYAKPGRNIFRFTGADLSPGCYFYSILKNKVRLTGKLIKSR